MTDQSRPGRHAAPDPSDPEPGALSSSPNDPTTPESTVDSSGGETFTARFLDSLWRANTVTVTILAIVLAVIIGGILIVITDPDVRSTFTYFFAQPSAALSASWEVVSNAYANLFKGAFIDPAAIQGWINGTNDWRLVFYPISETLTYATPLILTGLGVALAFRGGLFNIGGQGQAIAGVIVAGVLGFAIHLPPGIHLVVALIGGFIGGALWGFIPGVLKARTGAHEVIVTIMLNYIAQLLLNWLIIQGGVQIPSRTQAISRPLDSSAKFPALLGGNLRVDGGLILALLATVGVAWLLNRSTFGFELRAVGANPSAARSAGMSVARTTIIVMTIAGALAGLGGSVQVLGTQANALTGSVTGTIGFDGILVALLGRVKPWGVVLAAILFGALHAGGQRMQSYSGISLELTFVLEALIVMFVAAPSVVKAIFRLREARGGKVETTLARGW
jgi:simple sugar transport system permease protein